MYRTFRIPKRSGGFRTIEAPNAELKLKQTELLNKLYKKIPVSPFCYGGVKNRNIVTNAMHHVKQTAVGSVDISNCFPSVTKQSFIKACNQDKIFENEPDLFKQVLDLCFYNDHLPQGAPTSPYLLNIFLRKFDWHMGSYCTKRKFTYTRYFDDITISYNKENTGYSSKFLYTVLTKIVPYYLERYHLHINPKKTRIIHRGRRQTVCGIVVNEKVNLNRRWRKNLRAEIFQSKNKKSNVTKGKEAYLHMTKMQYDLLNNQEFFLYKIYQYILEKEITGDMTLESRISSLMRIFSYYTKDELQKLARSIKRKKNEDVSIVLTKNTWTLILGV